jgi:two-component system, NtrC family, sensor kinase
MNRFLHTLKSVPRISRLMIVSDIVLLLSAVYFILYTGHIPWNLNSAAPPFSSPLVLLPVIIIAISLITVTLITLVYFNDRKKFRKQIAEINNTVLAISQKEFDHRLNEEYSGEVGLLSKSINRMSLELKEIYSNLEIKVIKRTSEISMRNAELRTKQHEILQQNHELKSAYEALKDSREKYEKLIEQLEEEYIFYSQSVKGDLLYVSTSVKKILGFNVKEYRKLSEELYTENPVNIMARERSQNLRNGIAQPKYLKEIFDATHHPKIFEVTEVPVFNDEGQLVSVEGVAHDITEREQAEELIIEQEEKYRMLFAYASDFIFLYEIDKENARPGNIIEANNYMTKQLGYTLDEIRVKTPANLCSPVFFEEEVKDDAEYLANDIKYERIWESKDGNTLNVEISSHAFKIRNKHVAIAVARDISERKRAVEEIRFVNEELTNQKENLEALVDNLTQTQEQLVQSEKMAALGQLIAGIAHEINTPLGAIKASIGNLSDSLENALSELPELLQQQSTENLQLFSKLFKLAHKKAPELSSREKRQLKKDLTSSLKEKKIEQPDIIADILVFLDIYEIDEPLAEYLQRPDALKIIRSVRNFISLLKNSTTINIAVEKATKVVFALKKYAHRDSGGEKVPTDIIDGIETVLTLYHNQLKQGIEVIRDYESLPLIPCYQDEISQVWTNLVQNAIQAMNLEGTLTITAKYLDNSIMVSFKDTGTGIEPDILDKIFEPFFTTKKQGEGSGLGLDIVKKIIEKHDGTIRVESTLGKGAHFIINIPVN